MKNAAVFLAGKYRQQHVALYRQMCRGKTTVAADGGYRFFALAGLTPDLLIGDLDSIGRHRPRLSGGMMIIEHPPDKDCTDGELALSYCLAAGARAIDIIDPSVGEIDHFLGNLFMLELAAKYDAEVPVRIVSDRTEVRLLSDASWTVNGLAGQVLSVIPLSSQIKLTCVGTVYPVRLLALHRGQTRSLRNRIANRRARISVEGQAFVVHSLRT